MNNRLKAEGGRQEVEGSRLQEGFTLLEVMIAVAIIAIALVTLLGLGNRSIEINRQTQMITQATLLAQQRISEIEAAVKPGYQFQEEEGAFEPPFEIYRWRIAFQETPIPLLRMVTVTVAWGEEARNEMVDLTSFVFTP